MTICNHDMVGRAFTSNKANSPLHFPATYLPIPYNCPGSSSLDYNRIDSPTHFPTMSSQFTPEMRDRQARGKNPHASTERSGLAGSQKRDAQMDNNRPMQLGQM